MGDTINFEELLGDPSPAAPDGSAKVPAGQSGETAHGAYEGADRYNSVLSLWSPPLQSADADILPDKPVIDGRVRDIAGRNDVYAHAGVALHKDNIAGPQYVPNSRPYTRIIFGKEDEAWEEAFQEEVETLFDLYAESLDHWVDASRTNTLSTLLRQGIGEYLVNGEILAAVEWIRDDGAPFSTAIQMIDPDRLSNPTDRMLPWENLPNQRAGIKFNDRGAPQSYFIRSEHPNDYGPLNFELPKWKEVPVRKPWGRLQIIHLFEQKRPDQSRGITELAAALKSMKLTHTLQDIQVQQLLTQSMYAAAITSDAPDEATIFAQLGGGQITPERMLDAYQARNDGYLSAVAQYAGGARGLQIDGVKIPRLYPGEKLELLSPGKGGALGTDFEQSLLRSIAAAFGVSYEQLSRDYTHTNYSSARAAMNETWKFMQSRKKLFIDRFASIIFRLWLEEAINKNVLTTFPAKYAPMLYTGNRLNLKFDALSRVDWIGAARGQIDETKETLAAQMRIDMGISTSEEENARMGRDWRRTYRQLAREQRKREQLGLTFVGTDPAAVAALSEAEGSGTQKDSAE